MAVQLFRKLNAIFILMLCLAGCSTPLFPIHTNPLNPQTLLELKTNKIPKSQNTTLLSINPTQVYTASIGEELFTVERYKIQTHQTNRALVNSVPEDTLAPFPKVALWYASYTYTDNQFQNLLVYTSPSFYGGKIGVILDNNMQAATNKPIVQVQGKQTGRRWSMVSTGAFFSPETVKQMTLLEHWALRYGGKVSGHYVFEIFNRREAETNEILQNIKITEENFSSGFIVRGIMVKGENPDQNGLIQFSAQELYYTSQ